MKLLKITLILIAFSSAFAFQQRADERFVLKNSVLGNGGNVLSAGDYRIVGTLGQPFIGVAQGHSNANRVGFWYLANPMLATSVKQTMSNVPTEFQLQQNYPNPFNPTTTIEFALPKQSNVTLKLFDILGREVATLVDAELESGVHKINFDGKDLASGMYFYRIHTEGFMKTKKLMLLK